MAVHGPHSLVAIGHALTQITDEFAIQLRNGIAHGIGHVDGRCTFVDDSFNHAGQKVGLAAVAIFGAELDVIHQVAPKTHGLLGLLQHLLGRHAQLFFHVQRTGRNKGVDAAAIGILQRLGSPRNIAVIGARK